VRSGRWSEAPWPQVFAIRAEQVRRLVLPYEVRTARAVSRGARMHEVTSASDIDAENVGARPVA